MPSRAKALARLALQLRAQKFEWALNFHASPSSATLAFATGAGTRSIHFHGHKDKNRYSTVTVPGKGQLKPIIERDMDTVRALGIHVPAGRAPKLFLQEREKEKAIDRLKINNLTWPILGIALGASRPTKIWPIDRYASLAVKWCQETGGSVVVMGSLMEMPKFQEFLKSVDDELTVAIPSLTERAPLRSKISCEIGSPIREVAAVLSQCSVLVGNDSGPRHIAVAVGTPTVTLFGPEDPYEWHPYPTEQHPYFFTENLACRKDAMPGFKPWCGLYICVEEQHRCMTDLGVAQVFEQCKNRVKQVV